MDYFGSKSPSAWSIVYLPGRKPTSDGDHIFWLEVEASKGDWEPRRKSLDKQKVREIGRKEAEESAGLCMGMIVAGFQQEGKMGEDQNQLKM